MCLLHGGCNALQPGMKVPKPPAGSKSQVRVMCYVLLLSCMVCAAVPLLRPLTISCFCAVAC